MTARARISKLAAVLASAALFVPFGPFAALSGASPVRMLADSVTVTVEDVSLTTLNTTSTLKPLTISLSVRNRTNQDLEGVRIEGERGEPIETQAALDRALQRVSPPSGLVVPIEPTRPLRLDLPAGATEQVTFRTTSSILTDHGLCTCHKQAVYPLYFTAHLQREGEVDQRLGIAGTFVSSFLDQPAPVRVSWVWPLIDQPHLLDDTPVGARGPVFNDDFLGASVGTGGRLDRALAVVERVARSDAQVPVTLVVDPELLDELELMASGPYEVRTSPKTTVPGTGQAVAAAWLQRLQTLLGTAPQLRLQLTPYADPDVESLHASGLSWSTSLPASMRQQVERALDGHTADTSVAWPAGGAVSGDTLTALAGKGVSTVLVRSSSVAPRPAAGSVRPGLARLSVRGKDVAAALLDPALQQYAGQAVTAGGPGMAVLPQLVSELAIRAAQEPQSQHVAVLAPPRWVDPSVDTAARVIEQTSRSSITRPISLGEAVGGELLPNGRSRLTAVPASARTLPQSSLDAGHQVATDLPALTSLLTPQRPETIDPRAKALLTELPLEAQRAAASAWGRPGNGESGTRFARVLKDQLYSLTHGVTIVNSSSGSYTLASDNSPLPITVHNNLPFQVSVMVQVTPVNGLPGFTADPAREVVEARSKGTVRLATNVDRTGRIRVQAALLTPDGRHRVGDPVDMTVRSTALGVVGVIITIGAGAVLVLALLVRFGRRLRKRMHKDRPPPPRWDPDELEDGPGPEVVPPAAHRTPAEPAP